jgi:hypothetical protein
MKTMIVLLMGICLSYATNAQTKPVVFVITDTAKKPINNAILMLGNVALYKTGRDGLAYLKSISKGVYKIKCEGYQTKSGIHVNPINPPAMVEITLLTEH